MDKCKSNEPKALRVKIELKREKNKVNKTFGHSLNMIPT